jgi:hypothetical protein
MDFTKLLLGITAGAVTTGICFTIALYCYELIFPSGGFGISWQLALIAGVMYGVPIGGVIGAIITILQLSTVKGVLLGSFLGFLIGFALSIFGSMPGEVLDNKGKYIIFAFIITGLLNGAVVSFLNSLQQTLK